MKNNIPPFTIGQKVVCINDVFFSHGIDGEITPKNGNTYTVRGIFNSVRGFSITLVEIKNNERMYRDGLLKIVVTECRFLAHRFRPLQELKAPILTFEKIKEEEKEEILILN